MGIVVLSAGDLLVTVAHLRSTGMAEANPIADLIIRHTGSVAVLSLYKALTVAVCVGLLFHLRRHAEGEIAAWCAMMILALACIQWYHYSSELEGLPDTRVARSGVHGDNWLVLD